ncbi:MAG: hypothetical protein Ct9H300mP1_27210 [Planctomycetaceae bacterium]|nr:MAG: hypothetical protein Ct9H300mP1_27210 [Planctomycetaceae bacterium]
MGVRAWACRQGPDEKKAAPDVCPKRLLWLPGTGLCRGATYGCSADYRRGTTGLKFACPRLPKGSTFEPDPPGLIRTRLAKRAKLPAVACVLLLGSCTAEHVGEANHANGVPVVFVVEPGRGIVLGEGADDVLPLAETVVALGTGHRGGTFLDLFDFENRVAVGISENGAAGGGALTTGAFQNGIAGNAACRRILRRVRFVEHHLRRD